MAYGTTQDYFGLADTQHQLQTSAENPGSGGNAQAMDSDGDVLCETVYGEHNVYEVAYQIVSHAKDTGGNYVALDVDDSAKIGTIFAIDTSENAVVTGIALETSNTEHPTLTITAETFEGDTSDQSTYSSGVEVLGIKRSQAFGFSPDTGSRVNSGSLTLSSQTEIVMDSQGDRAAVVVYQGRAEASGELVACTGTPGATADTANSWAFNVQPSLSQENTGYGTSSVAVFKNLTPDT